MLKNAINKSLKSLALWKREFFESIPKLDLKHITTQLGSGSKTQWKMGSGFEKIISDPKHWSATSTTWNKDHELAPGEETVNYICILYTVQYTDVIWSNLK
jgi:hypothetical protein